VFVRNRSAGTTTLISSAVRGSATGNGGSSAPVLSSDGSTVAFLSDAGNLTADTNTNGVGVDVFVRPVSGGRTTLVSVRSSGGGSGTAASDQPASSVNGRFVAFHSLASDLVSGDTNGKADVFVRDLVSGSTTLVSGNAGLVGNGTSDSPTISADGRFVAF